MDVKTHWESIYSTKAADAVSWFKPHSEISLQLISEEVPDLGCSIIDVGGGASTLVDDLMAKGYEHLTVLDISEAALGVAKKRLGSLSAKVAWIASDITKADLAPQAFDLWHDRAVFHFLTSPEVRKSYVATMRSALKPRSHAIISTFALDGPERCSGIDIIRYDPNSLAAELGSAFKLKWAMSETHITPFNTEQRFVYCVFTKI